MLPVVAAAGIALIAGGIVCTAVARAPVLDLDAPELTVRWLRREIVMHPRVAEVLRRRLDPARATGAALAGALATLALSGAAVGVLLAMVRARTGIARSDMPLATWAAEQATDRSTEVLRAVSALGGTGAIVGVCVVVAVLEHRRAPGWSLPLLFAVTVGGQFAIVAIIKELVERARPDLLQLSGFAGASFPSGHATAAAATYACIALVLGRGRPRRSRAALAGVAAAIATGVAATRVLLGVHWFTDTLAGAALGWGWFALCSIAFGGRALRFGRPAMVAERVASESAM